MANRSYLYSIDAVPYCDSNRRHVIGLSEWNFDIPLAYKLLVSKNPCVCRSMIWDVEDPVAIVGDYQAGLQLLKSFLAETRSDVLKSAANEAIRFLSDPKVQQPLILLECGEIFDLDGENWAEQNAALLQEIKDIGRRTEGYWRHTRSDADETIAKEIGLRARWSNILYFEPANAENE
jgi:hypothetical protein